MSLISRRRRIEKRTRQRRRKLASSTKPAVGSSAFPRSDQAHFRGQIKCIAAARSSAFRECVSAAATRAGGETNLRARRDKVHFRRCGWYCSGWPRALPEFRQSCSGPGTTGVVLKLSTHSRLVPGKYQATAGEYRQTVPVGDGRTWKHAMCSAVDPSASGEHKSALLAKIAKIAKIESQSPPFSCTPPTKQKKGKREKRADSLFSLLTRDIV